jgi:hypothetical protein
MAWRPIHCRAMPRRPTIANDKSATPPPMRRYAFDIYRAAARARWVAV